MTAAEIIAELDRRQHRVAMLSEAQAELEKLAERYPAEWMQAPLTVVGTMLGIEHKALLKAAAAKIEVSP